MKYISMSLLCIFSLTGSAAFAQSKTYQLKADSVRIFSSCDTAELILENRTRDVLNGALINKGNGVTAFKKIMVKLNDSLYSIGGDTLNAGSFGKNIYNANAAILSDRVVDGANHNLQFRNNDGYLISNNSRQVIISRTPMDSSLLNIIRESSSSPFAGLSVRGTGCDASIELLSDSVGTCNQSQMIDFATLKPRKDSWLTSLPGSYGDKYLLGRMELQTNNKIPDYASLSFSVKSDTAFFHDGAFTFFPAGLAGGYMPLPIMSINPSFKDPRLGFNSKMPFVQVNGGLFVGYGRNWYFNSRNARDIIPGVDDVAGYSQPFFETRFSVYADSLPLKMFKLPSMKGSAFLTYSPARNIEGNNVAFEYKDSIYEEVSNYISMRGITTPSDLSIKENISKTQFNGDMLLAITVKEFNYKADKDKKRYTGLIAQELKARIPELVTGTEGNLGIDYIKMVPYLLKIIQDQQQQIQNLEAGISEIRGLVNNK